MGRCGCGSTCACVARAGQNITISGSGSEASPWVIEAIQPTCAQMMVCICANLAPGMACTAGKLGVKISGDNGNIASFGTDGGLLVPGADSGGVTTADTGSITLLGAGEAASPLSAEISRHYVSPCPFTAESGWAIASCSLTVIGGMWLEGHLWLERTGAPVKSGAGDGNVSPDLGLVTIAAAYAPRPAFYEQASGYFFSIGVWVSNANPAYLQLRYFSGANLTLGTGNYVYVPIRWALQNTLPAVPASAAPPAVPTPGGDGLL